MKAELAQSGGFRLECAPQGIEQSCMKSVAYETGLLALRLGERTLHFAITSSEPCLNMGEMADQSMAARQDWLEGS